MTKVVEELKERINRNRRRLDRVAVNARRNRRMNELMHGWLDTNEVGPEAKDELLEFGYKTKKCCSASLYREHYPETLEYIDSIFCGHKMCHVCNVEREKLVRRKYIKLFQKYPELRKDYDFMHLTLTVPHPFGTWRNQKFYANELLKEFNWMRKKPFWKTFVYAGELGVEITRSEKNGMHIHIHALLLVHRFPKNRNYLHYELLRAWNNQTIDVSLEKREFTFEEKTAILKSNKFINDIYLEKLDNRGSTMLTLESLYVIDNGKKKYINPANDNDFLSGLMECIKYHFEPYAMNKDDKSYDFELMAETLPLLKNKPLYKKFGAFHGTDMGKELNLKSKSEPEEIVSDLEDCGNEDVIHPITLQPCLREEYRYVICNASDIYLDMDTGRAEGYRTLRKRYLDERHTLTDTIMLFYSTLTKRKKELICDDS